MAKGTLTKPGASSHRHPNSSPIYRLGAEPQYLPQLSPVRWAAMAFDRLNYPVDTVRTPDQLDQLVGELRALADAKPDGSAEALVQALGERAAELAGEATERRITEAVGQAERYVEGNPGVAAEIAKLYEFLTLYQGRP